MQVWVDPNSGWKYGFPKLWDEEKDKPIPEWLKENGYPMSIYCNHREWPKEEEDNNGQ